MLLITHTHLPSPKPNRTLPSYSPTIPWQMSVHVAPPTINWGLGHNSWKQLGAKHKSQDVQWWWQQEWKNLIVPKIRGRDLGEHLLHTPHFIAEDAEAQRRQESCPRSHSQGWQSRSWSPRPALYRDTYCVGVCVWKRVWGRVGERQGLR